MIDESLSSAHEMCVSVDRDLKVCQPTLTVVGDR